MPDGISQVTRGDLVNYKTVEDNKDLAKEELDRLVKAGYAVRSRAEDTEIKTMSKLGLILKTKEDGSLKKRLVIDLRRSGGNDKSKLPERLILPRIHDGVEMIRDLRRCHPQPPTAQEASQHWGMELVLIDISDAFMSLAVHPEEWPHCVSPSTEEGELVTFVALLFGFKTAPLLYSRLGALVARFLQACVDPTKAMHQVYLDDSLWALQGMLWERNSILGFVLYTMAAMGLRVAFKKGERANSLQWIGVKFSVVNMAKVVLTLPEKFMKELREVLQGWSNKGYAPIKELRAAAGRLSWLSGVLSRARWTTSSLLRSALLGRGRGHRSDWSTTGLVPRQAIGASPTLAHRVLGHDPEPSESGLPDGHERRPAGDDHHGCFPGSPRCDPHHPGHPDRSSVVIGHPQGLADAAVRERAVELPGSSGSSGNLRGLAHVEGETPGPEGAPHGAERLGHGLGTHAEAVQLQPRAQLLGRPNWASSWKSWRWRRLRRGTSPGW